jgi:hypothetical protein
MNTFEVRKQLRRQNTLIALLTLSCAALAFNQWNAKAPATDVKVRRLALVDANGTERLILTTESSDVRIHGKVYQRRSPAAGIIMQNADGNEVGGIAMLDDGTASFTLDGYHGKDVNERASLYVMPDGRSGVLVKDTKGEVRLQMEVGADGKTTMLTGDSAAKTASIE